MNNERLSRHITQENLALRSENTLLEQQMGVKDDMINDMNEEMLRLLNRIASDMVKRSDVDEIVKNAVSEEHDRMVAFYEEKMKAMATEYEAKIAAIEKKNGKGDNNGRKGSTRAHKRSNTQSLS